MAPETKICTECGKPFSYDPAIYQSVASFGRKITCSRTCQSKRGHRIQRERGEDKSYKYLSTTRKTKRVPASVRAKLDAQQAEIDRAVDAKMNEQFGFRVLRPGTPEFDRVAATITSLDKIRKTDRVICITAPIDYAYVGNMGRKESANTI